MSIVENQHYVPKFYLKFFSNEKGQVCVYDKLRKAHYSANPINVANGRFFYDFESDSGINVGQLIEKSFSEFESLVAPALGDLLGRLGRGEFIGFPVEERVLLAEFILYQIIRTSEFREFLGDLSNTLVNDVADLIEDEGVKQAFKSDATSSSAKDDQLKMILDGERVEASIRKLASRIWFIIDNQTDLPFYTSDHPVVRYTNFDIGLLALETYFPISPRFVLCILDRGCFKQLEILDGKLHPLSDPEQIEFYNLLQVEQSNRQIFSSKPEFELAKKVVEGNSSMSKPDRPRIHRIL